MRLSSRVQPGPMPMSYVLCEVIPYHLPVTELYSPSAQLRTVVIKCQMSTMLSSATPFRQDEVAWLGAGIAAADGLLYTRNSSRYPAFHAIMIRSIPLAHGTYLTSALCRCSSSITSPVNKASVYVFDFTVLKNYRHIRGRFRCLLLEHHKWYQSISLIFCFWALIYAFREITLHLDLEIANATHFLCGIFVILLFLSLHTR
jgi:hypothetical protein